MKTPNRQVHVATNEDVARPEDTKQSQRGGKAPRGGAKGGKGEGKGDARSRKGHQGRSQISNDQPRIADIANGGPSHDSKGSQSWLANGRQRDLDSYGEYNGEVATTEAALLQTTHSDAIQLPDEIYTSDPTTEKGYDDQLHGLATLRARSDDDLQCYLVQVVGQISHLKTIEEEIRGAMKERTDFGILQAQVEAERKLRADMEVEHRSTVSLLKSELSDKEVQLRARTEHAKEKDDLIDQLRNTMYAKDEAVRERETKLQQFEGKVAESEARAQEYSAKFEAVQKQLEEKANMVRQKEEQLWSKEEQLHDQGTIEQALKMQYGKREEELKKWAGYKEEEVEQMKRRHQQEVNDIQAYHQQQLAAFHRHLAEHGMGMPMLWPPHMPPPAHPPSVPLPGYPPHPGNPNPSGAPMSGPALSAAPGPSGFPVSEFVGDGHGPHLYPPHPQLPSKQSSSIPSNGVHPSLQKQQAPAGPSSTFRQDGSTPATAEGPAAGAADASSSPFLAGDEGMLIACLRRVVPLGSPAARGLTSDDLRQLDALLIPHTWKDSYQPLYGTVENFMCRHPQLFVVNLHDGTVHQRDMNMVQMPQQFSSMSQAPHTQPPQPFPSMPVTPIAVTPMAPHARAAMASQQGSASHGPQQQTPQHQAPQASMQQPQPPPHLNAPQPEEPRDRATIQDPAQQTPSANAGPEASSNGDRPSVEGRLRPPGMPGPHMQETPVPMENGSADAVNTASKPPDQGSAPGGLEVPSSNASFMQLAQASGDEPIFGDGFGAGFGAEYDASMFGVVEVPAAPAGGVPLPSTKPETASAGGDKKKTRNRHKAGHGNGNNAGSGAHGNGTSSRGGGQWSQRK